MIQLVTFQRTSDDMPVHVHVRAIVAVFGHDRSTSVLIVTTNSSFEAKQDPERPIWKMLAGVDPRFKSMSEALFPGAMLPGVPAAPAEDKAQRKLAEVRLLIGAMPEAIWSGADAVRLLEALQQVREVVGG